MVRLPQMVPISVWENGRSVLHLLTVKELEMLSLGSRSLCWWGQTMISDLSQLGSRRFEGIGDFNSVRQFARVVLGCKAVEVKAVAVDDGTKGWHTEGEKMKRSRNRALGDTLCRYWSWTENVLAGETPLSRKLSDLFWPPPYVAMN